SAEQSAKERDASQILLYQTPRGSDPMRRQCWIEFGNDATQSVRERFRSAGSAQCNVPSLGRLCQRPEGLKARVRFVEVRWEPHVVHHADHFLPVGILPRPADAFAYRALVRPEASRHRLVDNDDRRPLGCIGRSEEAALQQPNPEGLEIMQAHRFHEDFGPLAGRWLRLALNSERSATIKSPHRLRTG